MLPAGAPGEGRARGGPVSDHSPALAADPEGSGYHAVLLVGFGGPEREQDVMPFLRNVTRGRGVPPERLVEVSHHYQALGGRSPINEQTRALQHALQAEIDRREIALPVLWGNRNWDPFLGETVSAAVGAGSRRLLAVTTSAYSSYSSCRQYREDLAGALIADDLLATVTIDKVRPYFDRPGFLQPVADATVAAVTTLLQQGLSPSELTMVFTTHSIPTAMADTSGSAALSDHGAGGAYVAQHLAAAGVVAATVADRIGPIEWQLGYQSRSGPPAVPWLEPDINDVLPELAARGRRGVVVVPIGFISDHVEVVWDLDHEAADTAADLGLAFARAATPGTDPRFVAALVDLIQERCGGFSAAPPATPTRTRPDFCAPGCCVNLRGRKATVAGQDSAADQAFAMAGNGSAAIAGGASRPATAAVGA